MRKTITIILILSKMLISQNTDHSKSYNFLPVSVWYSGGKARAPMLSTITEKSEFEWRRDLQQIKQLGFNTVRTWVEWAHCEPQPGVYNFENLKLLCRIASEVDLRVFIQMYVDSAPDWVGKNFPDGQFEAQDCTRIKSQSAPGYCTDHDGVRQAVLNFYTETAKVAIQYPNFFGWDLWSEPHIVNWAYINYVPDVQFCFCPNTQAKFRNWLQKKYGSLESLNHAWYRNFTSWEDVEAPRFGTILSYTDFIDWKNFIYEKLANDLGMRYEAIRKIDTTHVITAHAAVPSIFYSPYNGYGATDDFLMAKMVDYYGTSLYPKHSHPDRHWELWKFSVAIDFSRSANRNNNGFFVGELQAGKGTIGLNIGNPILPEDLRIWIWSALSRGARGINIYAYYPMSSGYESGGYGLINLDGTITERAISTGKIAALINQNQSLFLNSKPVPAEIAVVYNPLAQMVGGEQRHIKRDMHYESLIGYYRFFNERNIPMDFIHRKTVEQDDLSQYKLIIIPYPLMFSQRAADQIKQFVQNGGSVVSEARLAWNNERGYAANVIPGMGLAKVFGIRETNIKMENPVEMEIIKNSHFLTRNIENNAKLKGSYFAESLQILNNKNSRILARLKNGSPVVVETLFGKGKTLFIGSFLGLANYSHADSINNKFLENLIQWSGITLPFTYSTTDANFPVEIRLHENSDGYLLFIINLNNERKQITVNLNMNKDGKFAVNEITSQKTEIIKSRNRQIKISTNVSGKNVKIFSIR